MMRCASSRRWMSSARWTNFIADHSAGILPGVLRAVAASNTGAAKSYGADTSSSDLRTALSELFQTDVEMLIATTGTASNSLALSCLCPPYGAMLCQSAAHAETSECGAPEFYSGGRLMKVKGQPDGRMSVDALRKILSRPAKIPHEAPPKVVSVTQPTESGAVYSIPDTAAICRTAHDHGIAVHMDGARFANALVAGSASPAELTWKCGVDVLSFGTTKNGTMGAEVLIFFKNSPFYSDSLLLEARYRHKRAGLAVEKCRFLSSQVAGYLEDDAWLSAAKQANSMATRLSEGLAVLDGVTILQPVEINMVFVEMPKAMLARLEGAGYEISLNAGSPDAQGVTTDLSMIRFRLVTSWAMSQEDVDQFISVATAG